MTSNDDRIVYYRFASDLNKIHKFELSFYFYEKPVSLSTTLRRQLRQVLGVKYPTTMRNAVVYERAKARPLSVEITEARWKMLGHTLRMHEKTPARLAMKYYFQIPPGVKKYRGRKRTSIITTINRDIERTRKKFPEFDVKPVKTELDLRNIRVKSLNRKHWQRRVSMVTKAAYSATTSTVMN